MANQERQKTRAGPPLTDDLVKITMTKYMETIPHITVSVTTPILQLLDEELLNCLTKHVALHKWSFAQND